MRLSQLLTGFLGVVLLILVGAAAGWLLATSMALGQTPPGIGAVQAPAGGPNRPLAGATGAFAAMSGLPERSISVMGVGQVKAKPDMATLNLGVQTRAQTAQQAQSQNADLMQKVIDAIKTKGIKDDDITTRGLNLYPQMGERGETVVGYVANNNVIVVVRDLTKVGELLDSAVAAGANIAGGVQFSIADPTSYRNQAMELAVADAKARADLLAKSAGVSVARVISISEESGAYPVPKAVDEMAALSFRAATTPIQPGELTVSINVRVVYGF